MNIKELRKYCKDNGITVIGDERYTDTFLKAIARHEQTLQTHDVPQETITLECEGKTKEFPAYIVNDCVASSCASCPAFRWRGFNDGTGWCNALDQSRNGFNTYSEVRCDSAYKRWEETTKEDLENIYSSPAVHHPVDVQHPEINESYIDVCKGVMLRVTPMKNGGVFQIALYIGFDSLAEAENCARFLTANSNGRAIARVAKRVFDFDYEVRITKPRFNLLETTGDDAFIQMLGNYYTISQFR